MAAPSPPASGTVGLQDMLTALKSVVTALTANTQAYLSVNGLTSTEGISVPTVLKTSKGRVACVSITTGGGTGVIYDASQLGVTGKPLWVIPAAAATNGQPYVVNLPADYGILVVPGSGQIVTVSWS